LTDSGYNINDETYQKMRKRILDNANDAVREIEENKFMVSAALETLKLTNLGTINLNDMVNLETSLTLNKPLGGHLVQGHVACTSEIISKNSAGESIYFKFTKPQALEY
jgi:riboflavin synthase